MHNGPAVAWDANISEPQAKFIEWLVDPKREGTQKDLAEAIGIHEKTVSKWKADYVFRRAWDRKLAELNVSPDRLQRVIDSMYESATRGDVRAAQLYLQYVDRFIPKVQVLDQDADVAEMSDEELQELATNVVRLKPTASSAG